MISSPKFYKIIGSGKLLNTDFETNVSFEFFLINKRIVIYCHLDDSNTSLIIKKFRLFNGFDSYYKIIVITEDKKNFIADKLMITCLRDDFIELISNSQIEIGDSSKDIADKVIYPLSNLFPYNFHLDYNGFRINLESEKDSIKKNIATYWEIPQIAAKLFIEKLNEKIENYILLANYGIRLLSLFSGRYLSISEQYFYPDTNDLVIFQNNFSSFLGINEILPEIEVSDLPKIER
jgi:hypothetical protein